MTQTANNYGTALFELGVGKETVEEMKRIFSLTGELPRVLDCPVVSGREKHRLIEQLFPKEVWNFLKEMCDHGTYRRWTTSSKRIRAAMMRQMEF